MAVRKKTTPPPKLSIYDLLIKEVIPRLKTVEGEIQTVKGDVAGVKEDVAKVKQEVHDAGIGNGHAVLLAEFLDDQAEKKKRRQAYAAVGGDIKGRFSFLVAPRRAIARTVVFLTAATITGYSSAVFLGKTSFPPFPWPFHG